MSKTVPIAAAFGLLTGVFAIVIFEINAGPGDDLTTGGMGLILALSTAFCTAIGAVITFLSRGKE